jgi:CHASE3 domain sensor protein
MSDRDLNYIKALKRADESVDDFVSRIERLCTTIKNEEEVVKTKAAFREKMKEAAEIIHAVEFKIEGAQETPFDHSIKVEFYL